LIQFVSSILCLCRYPVSSNKFVCSRYHKQECVTPVGTATDYRRHRVDR